MEVLTVAKVLPLIDKSKRAREGSIGVSDTLKEIKHPCSGVSQ